MKYHFSICILLSVWNFFLIAQWYWGWIYVVVSDLVWVNGNYGFKALFLVVDMYVLVFVGTFSRMASTKQTTLALCYGYIQGDQDPDEGMHLLMHFSNSGVCFEVLLISFHNLLVVFLVTRASFRYCSSWADLCLTFKIMKSTWCYSWLFFMFHWVVSSDLDTPFLCIVCFGRISSVVQW